MRLNLNCRCTVTLTEIGAQRLNDLLRRGALTARALGVPENPGAENHTYRAGDKYTDTFHDIIFVFGGKHFLPMSEPFLMTVEVEPTNPAY